MVIPQTVGKYEILSAIGAGSMGTVYRAFDATLQRTVALKMINLGWTHELPPDELAERFRTEARAVARLNHPAIVTIFDYDDQDPAGAYIAMEYVDGCALDQYIRQRPEPHVEDAVRVMYQALGGLHYAHVRGVIHRDIKPHNLLITHEGIVKIMDFGIAKISSQNQTHSRFMMGTPLYMAREQYVGGLVDHRCDIHAAGAVLYELLTGSPPYVGTDPEVMYKICNERPKPLSALDPPFDPTIANALDPIVAKALEKRIEDRYASAADFAEALRAAWQAISSRPLSPKLSEEARTIAVAMSRQPVAVAPPPRGGSKPSTGSRTHPERPRDSQSDTWVRPAGAAATGSPAAQADSTGSAGPLPASSQPDTTQNATPVTSTPERSPEAGSLTAWSRDQLAEIERQLVPIIGPMARILVREAATTTKSRQEIYRLLATHLRTPEERQRFLLGGEGTSPGSTAPPDVANAIVSYKIARRPLTAEVTQRASQLLARYMGPIATVLTRRAAQTATDEAELYSMLAEKLTDTAERERFLSEAGRQQ